MNISPSNVTIITAIIFAIILYYVHDMISQELFMTLVIVSIAVIYILYKHVRKFDNIFGNNMIGHMMYPSQNFPLYACINNNCDLPHPVEPMKPIPSNTEHMTESKQNTFVNPANLDALPLPQNYDPSKKFEYGYVYIDPSQWMNVQKQHSTYICPPNDCCTICGVNDNADNFIQWKN